MLFLFHNWSIPVLVSFISSHVPSLRTLHLKGPCYQFTFLSLSLWNHFVIICTQEWILGVIMFVLINQYVLNLVHFIHFAGRSICNVIAVSTRQRQCLKQRSCSSNSHCSLKSSSQTSKNNHRLVVRLWLNCSKNRSRNYSPREGLNLVARCRTGAAKLVIMAGQISEQEDCRQQSDPI